MFSFADVRVDVGAHRLTRAGTEVGLEPKAFAVLVEFMIHPDQMLSRDQLLDAVWGHVYVTQATLNRLVVLLRRALGDDIQSPRYIQTVRGLGYRFIARLTSTSGAAPPSLSFAPPVHARLPERTGTLIGRERVIVELKGLLGSTRLVTVTGPGGIGKTQAALETARVCVQAFPDGIWLFDFTLCTNGESLERMLADAFGIREGHEGDSLLERLIEVLRTRRVLLLLDNCERVAEPLSHLVASLLSLCAELRVMVTSQQCLHCAGETIYSLPPLEAPASGAWATAEEVARLVMVPAVQLLLERSRSLASGFILTPTNASAVAELCRRLDGLPLALELAAARLRLLSPEQLLLRMQDRFQWQADAPAGRTAHHQTLGALIDWSYALLSGREQALLCAMGVFAGGWTLHGAMAIGAAFGLDGEQTLDLLGGLVDKSLVTVDANINPPRYSLLDSVRLFALAQLGKSGDEARVRRAHLAHCIDFTARVDAEVRGERQQLWVGRVLREKANLQAAFEHAMTHADLADDAITLCSNLCWYFRIQGDYRQANQWMDLALRKSDTQDLHRARVLIANGMAHHHRHASPATSLLQEGIALATQLGDDELAAFGQGMLAFEHAMHGDFDGSERCVEAALAVAEAHGSGWLRSLALLSRGIACAMRGQHREAEAWMSEAAELTSARGNDTFHHGYVLINRALQRFQLGDVRGAASDWLRMLELSIGLQNRRGVAGTLEGAAYLVLGQGDADCAARLLAAAARVRDLTGSPLFPQWYVAHAKAEASAREILGEAFKDGQKQGAEARIEDVVELTRSRLVELAALHVVETTG
ncbi:MAG TPA: winged helix-turn-helix domain-containing protein [Rhodanobacter sp.]|nr:winged helix-turn-helix domain-containing protein [Rhodanobacter sp.]